MSTRKGNTSIGAAFLCAALTLAIGSFGGLGDHFAQLVGARTSDSTLARTAAPQFGARTSDSTLARSAAPQLGSRAQAGVGTLLRHGPEVVDAMRRFAAAIPEGESQVRAFDKMTYSFGHIPDRQALASFFSERMPKYSSASESVALAQRDGLVYLVDRAFDEALSRGFVPGAGGRFSAKPPTDPFHAADVPWGVYAYNAHASGRSISTSKASAALGYGRDGKYAHVIAKDLVELGYRREPLILDACATASCIDDPQSAARHVAQAVDGPVIAPTKNVFITLPMPTENRNFVGRLVGNRLTQEGNVQLPVASGEWVLILPETWGGNIIRAPAAISD